MERVGNNKKKDPLRPYDKRGEEEKGNCKLCEIREVFCAAAGDALWDLLPVPRSLARALSMAVLHRTANSQGESPVCLGAFTDYTYNEKRLIFCNWRANLLTQLEFLLMGESLEALSA